MRQPKPVPSKPAEVVCFGLLVPAVTLVVDRFPRHNTGALITRAAEFLSDDAAIVACLLRQWRVRSGLICTALGNDPRGRRAARELARRGVQGKVRLLKTLTTPYEVNVSDRTGQRTYFWQRDARVLGTLDTADLAMLDHAKMVYVDWYDGDHILRPMLRARERGAAVFLNLEYGHQNPATLQRLARHATICQAVTDPAQRPGDALSIARALLDAGVNTAVVTLAGEGCLVANRKTILRARAAPVAIVDGCGAGASFSAGMIYGYLRGWSLEAQVRFAVAAGSYKCSIVGLDQLPVRTIQRLAQTVRVERVRIR